MTVRREGVKNPESSERFIAACTVDRWADQMGAYRSSLQ